jgi:uncharacterized protein (TIGR02246 family)
MEAVAYKATAKDEIRDLLESWREAAQAKDVERVVSHYAPEILAFDAIAQLQFKGKDAYKQHWQACMSMCPGAMIFEIHDLDIATQGDLAFGHYLSRCGTTGPDGEEKAGWMRVTVGCRKVNGKWMIVHEHFSAPFDPQSGKALFDLRP